MGDDDFFRREMEALGVSPLEGGRAPGRRRSGPGAGARRLRQALREETSPSRPRSAERADRGTRVEPVDERLDLHRLTAVDAVETLERFLAAARRRGVRRVLVITGRGRRSPGGAPVVRPRVEAWLRGAGRRLVAGFEVAPASLGGAGAFVVGLGPASDELSV